MLGETAKTVQYYNQSCLKHEQNGEVMYIPVASMSIVVKSGSKIPSSVQVNPINLELYKLHEEEVDEDYNEFYKNVMNDLNCD